MWNMYPQPSSWYRVTIQQTFVEWTKEWENEIRKRLIHVDMKPYIFNIIKKFEAEWKDIQTSLKAKIQCAKGE